VEFSAPQASSRPQKSVGSETVDCVPGLLETIDEPIPIVGGLYDGPFEVFSVWLQELKNDREIVG